MEEYLKKISTSPKYFGPALIIFILSGVFLINEWHTISSEQKDLLKEKASFYKEKSDWESSLEKQKMELKNELFVLEKNKESVKNETNQLIEKKSEFNQLVKDFEKNKSSGNIQEKNADAENKANALLSMFSDLGVNLSRAPKCGEEESKFNKARSILDELETLVNVYNLNKSYLSFIRSHEGVTHGCRDKAYDDAFSSN